MSEGAEFSLPEGFDPRYQLLNYTSVMGPFEVTFDELNHYYKTQVNNAIIYGVRIGAAVLAMLALFIVSRNRKTPVFLLNQACLLVTVIHSVFFIAYIIGNYGSITFQFTGFPELITRNNVNVNIATNFMQTLLVFFIQASLVFQVHTIFKDPNNRKLGNLLTGLSLATGLSVVGLYLYNFIMAAKLLLDDKTGSYVSNAVQAQPILFASSINLMSFLLIGKLILAIRSRRYLGLKQFDGFHILLIMTTQSLMIPSILLIISYAIDSWNEVSLPALSQLLVVLSLPLSSMWASAANNSHSPSSVYQSYNESTFKSPSGTGTSYYSHTLQNEKDEPSPKQRFGADLTKIATDNVTTPSTAINEDAKAYWLSNDAFDNADDKDHIIVQKTVHEITSDRSI
jgi:pheromone alpha factor receptor